MVLLSRRICWTGPLKRSKCRIDCWRNALKLCIRWWDRSLSKSTKDSFFNISSNTTLIINAAKYCVEDSSRTINQMRSSFLALLYMLLHSLHPDEAEQFVLNIFEAINLAGATWTAGPWAWTSNQDADMGRWLWTSRPLLSPVLGELLQKFEREAAWLTAIFIETVLLLQLHC